MLPRQIKAATLVLALFALVGTGLVAFTFHQTADRIAANEREAVVRNLRALLPPGAYDNDLFHDTLQVTAPDRLGTDAPLTVYRARKNGEPQAVVLTTVAPDGYSGAIKLLVGILYNGEVAGVRVVSHKETPGLGDAIEADRSDWIHDFRGKSLDNPGPRGWAVRKDGGEFDQFTGATITPRAVVNAVHNALIYFENHRAELFSSRASGARADA